MVADDVADDVANDVALAALVGCMSGCVDGADLFYKPFVILGVMGGVIGPKNL
jgi:hypothetical protein